MFKVTGTFEGHIATRGSTAGKFSNPVAFVEGADGAQKYAVVSLNTDVCVVDRDDYERAVRGTTWWRHADTGYVYGRANPPHICSMHSTLWTARYGSAAADTIDHIDRIKMDNRASNLRDVTMSIQNSNRGARADKSDAPSELAEFSVRRLPRYVVFEPHEMKFNFGQHPMAAKLGAAGVIVKTVGTKSAACGLPERLHDCLSKYVRMHEAHREKYGSATTIAAATREALRASFVAIVEAAHSHDPVNFPMPQQTLDRIDDDDDDDELFARAILSRIPAPVLGVTGTENRVRRFVKVPEASFVLCYATTQYPAFMFDERHVPTLETITWDMDSGRITSNPEMVRRFPRTFASSSAHVPLAVFIARELEGAVLDPARETVTTFTPIRQDLRAANLIVAPLTPRGYKPSWCLEPPEGYVIADGPAPIRFLPRGISMARGAQLEFHVRMSPIGDGKVAPRKFSIKSPALAQAIFDKSVVPMLEAGWAVMLSTARLVAPNVVPDERIMTDWRVGHTHFTELIEDYEVAQVLVGAEAVQ